MFTFLKPLIREITLQIIVIQQTDKWLSAPYKPNIYIVELDHEKRWICGYNAKGPIILLMHVIEYEVKAVLWSSE